LAQRNKRAAIIGGAGLAFVLASCLALGANRARACRIGGEGARITIEIGRVWPAFGGAKLKNVRFRAGQPEWLSGELETVDVRVGSRSSFVRFAPRRPHRGVGIDRRGGRAASLTHEVAR